ncbi:hypothetical protein [Streptomyces sp. NBC_00158]|uniref:hypothetical protein n=1 Tax=Streptomyces sp. NBC_00158 TaxID=2903627 RepID=UPI0032445EB9
MGQKTEETADQEERGRRKLDLSATQVAGSSLATVAAALLASKMGVYGTILGAGVVSVVATAGGPVIQHLFRRTGDQLRESARPRSRQVPPPGAEPDPAVPAPAPGEFGEATVHGTRVRGWKRTAVASGAAFALALGGLGTYEAFAGTSVSSDGRTLLSGGSRTAPDHEAAPRKRDPEKDGGGNGTGRRGEPGGQEGRGGTAGTDGKAPGSGTSPSPSRSGGGQEPSPTPSGSKGPVGPTPAPTPSKQSPDPGPTPGSGGPAGGREPSPGAP